MAGIDFYPRTAYKVAVGEMVKITSDQEGKIVRKREVLSDRKVRLTFQDGTSAELRSSARVMVMALGF